MPPPPWLTWTLLAGPSAAALIAGPWPQALIFVAPLLMAAYMADFFRGRRVGGWVHFTFALLAAGCLLILLCARFVPSPPPVEGLELYGSFLGATLVIGCMWLCAVLAIGAGFVATAVFDPPLKAAGAATPP